MKKIAVTSGKGGTGKTTLSLLIYEVLKKDNKVQLLDCDVENPDCHLFIKGKPLQKNDVNVFYPVIDKDKCSFCRKCQEVCAFNCLLVMKEDIMFFPELCHPCKGCLIVCPEGAITGGMRKAGEIYSYKSGSFYFDYAVLNVGEARANPLIEEVKKKIRSDVDYAVIDSPPGANCPMVEAVKNTDYVLLVTEPTPFGLYDLEIVYSVLKKLDIPNGIVINRSEGDDGIIEDFARKEKIPVLFKIPFLKKFAEYYSKGEININLFPGLEEKIRKEFHAVLQD